jgi:hypothetical protein
MLAAINERTRTGEPHAALAGGHWQTDGQAPTHLGLAYALSENASLRHLYIIANLNVARRLMASFSKRVAVRRHSLSQPAHCSITDRLLQTCLLKGTPPCRWFEHRGITGVMRCA